MAIASELTANFVAQFALGIWFIPILYFAATLSPHPKPLSQAWERGFEGTGFVA